MTWLQKYRLVSFVRTSVWLPSLIGLLAALAANRLMESVDRMLPWPSRVGVDGARILLTSLSSSMLTFIVFVFSILLLAVQLASAQLTPRVIAHFYRTRVLRLSLALFVFVFTFDLAVVVRIDTAVPRPSASLADVPERGVHRRLPVHDRQGRKVAAAGHDPDLDRQRGTRRHRGGLSPSPSPGVGTAAVPAAALPAGDPPRTIENHRPGVVLAFDPAGLAALARKADGLIEVVPQVGDFVAMGDPLFRVYGGRGVDEQDLQQSVAIGPERTLEQDPAFAFRIIVDIAAKALSPAINDPTTAVLAIDQVHHLLRSVGQRDLDTGQVRDETGRLRLVYRTPDWEDLVGLAVTEIRHCGKDSIQIARRLRAMLENLIRVVPPERAVRLREELDLLKRTVGREVPGRRGPRAAPTAADSLGMGGSPGRGRGQDAGPAAGCAAARSA